MFQHNVFLVTGGTSGIGKATVIQLIQQGARVCFIGRNGQEADTLLSQLGDGRDRALFVRADVSDVFSLEVAIQQAVQWGKRLDGVFANAGYHTTGTIEETSLEERNHIIQVDLTGTFLTLKYTIPHLRQAGGGSIVIMGSDQSLIGKPRSCAYGVTKGALGQLTKSTAIDYAPDNIRVNCVCPGTIDTPLARGAMQRFADEMFDGDLTKGIAFLEKAQPIQRLGTPEEVASLVCFLLSDQTGFMTGSLVSIDGGYTAG